MKYVIIVRSFKDNRVKAYGFHSLTDAVRQAKNVMWEGKRAELVSAEVFAYMRRNDYLPKMRNQSPFEEDWEWEGTVCHGN